MYGYNNRRVALDDLIAWAWSAPMRDLAARVGMSDVGVKKTIRAHGVVCPPQGYWNKLRAGKKVPSAPKAPPRRPGERGYVLLDARFNEIPEAPLPSPDGPFATSAVPEDLEQLRKQELAALKPRSAKTMTTPHPDIAQLIERDAALRKKRESERWYFGPDPLFESPYERRRLRIFNAIFKTLESRGHRSRASRQDHVLDCTVFIGDTALGIEIVEYGKRAPNRYDRVTRADSRRSASVSLELSVGGWGSASLGLWRDDRSGALEDRIGEICAGIIVAGEAQFRNALKEQAEQEERRRLDAARDAEVARKTAEAQRVRDLLHSGELLAQAENLRAVVAKVEAAVLAGDVDITPERLAKWRSWALEQADSIDPVKSGQIESHLGLGF